MLINVVGRCGLTRKVECVVSRRKALFFGVFQTKHDRTFDRDGFTKLWLAASEVCPFPVALNLLSRAPVGEWRFISTAAGENSNLQVGIGHRWRPTRVWSLHPMSIRSAAALTVAALAVFMAPLSAEAGGRGCVAECYTQKRVPAVYKTVSREVVVRPGRRQVIRTPAVTRTVSRRVLVSPGRTRVERIPAVYRTMTRNVMVRSAQVSYSHTPPVTRTVHRTVVVSRGGYRWVRRHDRHGRVTMCKVRTSAVTKTVPQTIVVSRGRRVRHVRPAVYKTVHQRVLVRPASSRRIHSPSVYKTVHRQVVVRPASRHVVHEPAVTRTEHQRVLVSPERVVWEGRRGRRW